MGATVVFRSGHCISRLQHQDFAWGPEMARLGTAKWPDRSASQTGSSCRNREAPMDALVSGASSLWTAQDCREFSPAALLTLHPLHRQRSL